MPTLDWLDREQAMRRVDAVPYRLLESVSSHGDPSAGNLLIHGDNLEALRALLPFYRGRVKCIHIDPPYNTRSAFEHYDDNLEHSQWLSMMYPRLVLLRELLPGSPLVRLLYGGGVRRHVSRGGAALRSCEDRRRGFGLFSCSDQSTR